MSHVASARHNPARVQRRNRSVLFIIDTGRRLDRHAVYAFVRSAARRAGLPHANKISPHSLRHAFVTAAREAGAPLEDVQDALRHADPEPPAATTATATATTSHTQAA